MPTAYAGSTQFAQHMEGGTITVLCEAHGPCRASNPHLTVAVRNKRIAK